MAGRQIPVSFDDVPDGQLLPAGVYLMAVDSIEETSTKEVGKLMYKLMYQVQEPKEYDGVPFPDYYVIGSNEDPKANEPETWKDSIGFKRFKRLARATQVPFTNDMEQLIERLCGQKFIAVISQELDQNPRDPKFANSKKNRIKETHQIGAMNPRISGGSDAVVAAPTAPLAPAPPAPKPAAKVTTASSTLSCPYCQETMPRAAYGDHRRAKHPEEE